MELKGWAQYVPPPGSRYRLHYVADGHSAKPDIAAMSRALDARPAVALKGMAAEPAGVAAEVVVYIGDMPLLSVLGTSLSDGGDNFWRIEQVERTDEGVPSGVGVTVGRMLDAILDPFQDVSVAAKETAVDTFDTVKRVGLPTTLIVGAAIVAFLLARAAR